MRLLRGALKARLAHEQSPDVVIVKRPAPAAQTMTQVLVASTGPAVPKILDLCDLELNAGKVREVAVQIYADLVENLRHNRFLFHFVVFHRVIHSLGECFLGQLLLLEIEGID